jgi:hypothetical protein
VKTGDRAVGRRYRNHYALSRFVSHTVFLSSPQQSKTKTSKSGAKKIGKGKSGKGKGTGKRGKGMGKGMDKHL